MSQPTTEARRDVVVVGAGAAGLAAAVALARDGARVTLLERRPFVGGRAYSYLHPAASCTASSAEEKSPKRRATTPSTCGASSRSRPSDASSQPFAVAGSVTASPAAVRS